MGEALAVSVLVSGLRRLVGEDPAALLDLAAEADAAGVDQIVLPDHLAIGPRTDRYPYGPWPVADDEPWLEPLATLAALAARTRRIRLATGILVVPPRPALLLAKTAATVDVLSRGRLDLGVGTGWQREEIEAAGVPFRGRAARMDDALRACRALWREAPADFASGTVSFRALRCLPRPVQPGGPPLWIGGALSDANLARLVEYGSGWMPVAGPEAELASGVARARQAFAAAGRDPATLRVRASATLRRTPAGAVDLDATLADLSRWRALGASHVSLPLAALARRPAEVAPLLARIGRAER